MTINATPDQTNERHTPAAASQKADDVATPMYWRILQGSLISMGLRKRHPGEPLSVLDPGGERTYWAAERTLMAWIRTGISMITFGFTIGKIGQAVQSVEVQGLRGMRQIGVNAVAEFLVILGTLSLLAAAVQFSVRVYELHREGLRRQVSIGFGVALLLVLLGLFAISALVMQL